jgi:hypothetical protein
MTRRQATRRQATQRQTIDVDAAVATGRARFRRLPERVRPEDTYISVPATAPAPGRDTYDHDEWLTRNAWCGGLI